MFEPPSWIDKLVLCPPKCLFEKFNPNNALSLVWRLHRWSALLVWPCSDEDFVTIAGTTLLLPALGSQLCNPFTVRVIRDEWMFMSTPLDWQGFSSYVRTADRIYIYACLRFRCTTQGHVHVAYRFGRATTLDNSITNNRVRVRNSHFLELFPCEFQSVMLNSNGPLWW